MLCFWRSLRHGQREPCYPISVANRSAIDNRSHGLYHFRRPRQGRQCRLRVEFSSGSAPTGAAEPAAGHRGQRGGGVGLQRRRPRALRGRRRQQLPAQDRPRQGRALDAGVRRRPSESPGACGPHGGRARPRQLHLRLRVGLAPHREDQRRRRCGGGGGGRQPGGQGRLRVVRGAAVPPLWPRLRRGARGALRRRLRQPLHQADHGGGGRDEHRP
mmetsp:Transcript_70898/g.189306  ORF Transcript_70898/g.189306 Transcript_70898/m.189306 type:complete len:215 (-) Transcript_70898:303-947(-)